MIAAALKFLSELAWLRIARIAAPALVIALLLGWALWTRSMLATTQRQLDTTIADVTDFRRLATDATVAPGKDGTRPLLSTPDAKAALVGVFRDRDDARHSLGEIGRNTAAAKGREVAADAALARQQAANAKTYERAAPRIEAMATAKPTGKIDEDATAIDKDSETPWEGWK